MLESCTSE
ncbi:B lymphocyte-induced maturation protein 1, partial [Araneus ventricosus]